jgi:hypothetical protein
MEARRLANIAMGLGIFSFCLAIVGLVLAIMGL